jgi:hypothetical protein
MLKVREVENRLSVVQRTLAERCLGAVVSFSWGGRRLEGKVVFVDYQVFMVMVETERGTKFADPRRCTVVARRRERVAAKHYVRVPSFRQKGGWHGSAVVEPGVAEEWLEPH